MVDTPCDIPDKVLLPSKLRLIVLKGSANLADLNVSGKS